MRLITKCGNGHHDVVPFIGVGRAYAMSVASLCQTTARSSSRGCGLCGSRDVTVEVAGYSHGERVRIKAKGVDGRVRDVTPDRVIVEWSERVGITRDGSDMMKGPVRVESFDEDDLDLVADAFEVGALVRVDDERVGRVTERHGIAHVVLFDDGDRAFVDGSVLRREL